MIKNCCFFGHESLPVTWVIELKVMHEIEDLIQKGLRIFMPEVLSVGILSVQKLL